MDAALATVVRFLTTTMFLLLSWHFLGKHMRAKKAERLLSHLCPLPAGGGKGEGGETLKLLGRLWGKLAKNQDRWPLPVAALMALPFLLRGNPLPALLVPVGAAITKRTLAKRSVIKRVALLEEQVTDLLDSLSQSLRAGNSLSQALELSLEDVEEELRQEISPAVMALKMGESPETSLSRLAEITSSQSLRLLCRTLVLLHAKGGDIPRILERLRDKISESRDIRRELEAMTAQSRASGYLVSALPGVFLLLQASTNPRSVSPLLLTPLGNLLGALALGMNLAGFLAVRRIVDLERA